MQPEPPRFIPVWAVAAILKRPHRTIRNWAADGRIPSTKDPKTGALLVDGAAATLLHDQSQTRRRVRGVSDCVVKSSKSSSEQAPVSLDPGASSRLEGVAVADLPVDPPRIRLLMCPELDPAAVEKFRAQVAELAAETTARLANAVTSGLTVHLNGPQDT